MELIVSSEWSFKYPCVVLGSEWWANTWTCSNGNFLGFPFSSSNRISVPCESHSNLEWRIVWVNILQGSPRTSESILEILSILSYSTLESAIGYLWSPGLLSQFVLAAGISHSSVKYKLKLRKSFFFNSRTQRLSSSLSM